MTTTEKVVLHGGRGTRWAECNGKRYRITQNGPDYDIWIDDGTSRLGTPLTLAFNLAGVREVIRLHATGEITNEDELFDRAADLIGKGRKKATSDEGQL